jgi:hypothetical protein
MTAMTSQPLRNMAAMMAIASASGTAVAAPPILHCQARYLSDTVRIDARPVADPYTVAPHDIGGRFSFKAVVVGDEQQVDHIALYAYDLEVPGAPVLIHQVVLKPPFKFDAPLPALTGWNHVYSARLGRELVYGCALQGPTP